ncbi:protease HtpX [Acidithiobacillus sp. M4-SHS-6]|uniref:protease HtpX n=1 Tax=Acidithiobacillus sp. M4-SHS-6 TaxID=3383024 RepID=UPI0039BE3584
MKSFKSIALLAVANLLVFVALSITFSILVYLVLPAFGVDLRGVVGMADLLWALVIGFGGAFISLLLSKHIARAGMQMQRIEHPSSPKERLVYETVAQLSTRLGIQMPEVWVYWSDDPNAFATGPGRNHSMVAVSSGLVNLLNDQEVQAVLAHEMGHVYNGDMVSTTLLQGLMNTFVFWLSMLAARQFEDRPMIAFAVSMILEVTLSFLALIPITWFSRRREFAADRFAAEQIGAAAMISALQKLHQRATALHVEHDVVRDPMATAYISGSWQGLFATHPSLEARVAALQTLQKGYSYP